MPETRSIYLGTCVICGFATKSDFCDDCRERGEPEMNFGRCYHCFDYDDHQACIGVPCQCPCPPPDEIKRREERQKVLDKLTPYERSLLGW